jgi:hypothetical protein
MTSGEFDTNLTQNYLTLQKRKALPLYLKEIVPFKNGAEGDRTLGL